MKKKNAGEISITILAEVVSWYYPGIETLTIYSQDRDTYELQRKAEASLREIFVSRMPVPISYKSQDDHSVILVTELVDNDLFLNLVQDTSVRIIF